VAQLGDIQAGMKQMEYGIEAIRATGAEMGLPYLLGLLAETRAGAGRDGALQIVDQAIGSAMQNGSHFLLSEILRIKGEVLAQMKDRNSMEIESLLRSAVHTAAGQNASLPALRAATSLARFLSRQQRRAEAHAVLEPHATLIANLAGTQDAALAAEFS
jgi:predicted ATPase